MAKTTYDFVLDCSITMAWCFDDESSEYADAVLDYLEKKTAFVPTIWPLEVANVLLLAKKHGRINEIQSASFIDALAALPIIVDSSSTSRALHSVFTIAGQLNLTIYDATYLELAIREKIPLFTLDKELLKAAKKMDVITHIF
jgi:predicted nucleic acid-binding protein